MGAMICPPRSEGQLFSKSLMFQINKVNEKGVAGGDRRLFSLSILLNGRFLFGLLSEKVLYVVAEPGFSDKTLLASVV
jgi:hypothetical protein